MTVVGGGLVNQGTLTNEGKLTNNGVLTNDGVFANSGEVENDGLIITIAPSSGSYAGLNTLRFDANGGEPSFACAEPGASFNLNKLAAFGKNPTRAGYNLLGWIENPSGGPIGSPYAFTDGAVVYAQWKEAAAPPSDPTPPSDPGPQPGPALTVTPPTASLEVGGTVQLTASEAGVTWKSADEMVAAVDANGLVTAVGAGATDITATAPDGRTAPCRVTVTKPDSPDDPEPPEEFDIGIEVLAVKKGKELILPKITGYKGTWSTGDESVAKITKNGKRVKALKVGETTLTFRVDEVVSKKAALVLEDRKLKAGDSYTIQFNVRKAGELPTGITLDAKKLVLDLAENKAVKLTATVKPAKALDKEVFWTSNKPGVATVDKDGTVRAVSPGTCKIMAVSANLKRKTVTVTVLGAVTKVTLNTKKQTLNVGDTFTLTATVNEDALDKTIAWSSGKPGVASVDEHGVVTARGKGKATVTATASNGKEARCVITVK